MLTLLFIWWSGIAAQAAADKTTLKAHIDDLVAENSSLEAKADGLVDDVTQLKADSAKAQELDNQRRAEAESKEKDLQQRLQATLDSLHGKIYSSFSIRFMRIDSICKLKSCFFMQLLPN
jgi:Skp family chaperone for outer membrane proteins